MRLRKENTTFLIKDYNQNLRKMFLSREISLLDLKWNLFAIIVTIVYLNDFCCVTINVIQKHITMTKFK